jgi:hypothetical protein
MSNQLYSHKCRRDEHVQPTGIGEKNCRMIWRRCRPGSTTPCGGVAGGPELSGTHQVATRFQGSGENTGGTAKLNRGLTAIKEDSAYIRDGHIIKDDGSGTLS